MDLYYALFLCTLITPLNGNANLSAPFFVRIENVRVCELDPIVIHFLRSNTVIDSKNCNSYQNASVFSEKPLIAFPNAKDGASYVVLIMNLNATKCQSGKFDIHWMITNLPGNDFRQGRQNFVGTESFEYKPLPHGSTTKMHQIVCLVYEQNYNYHYFEFPWRRCFNPNDWSPTVTLREAVYGPVGGVSFNIAS